MDLFEDKLTWAGPRASNTLHPAPHRMHAGREELKKTRKEWLKIRDDLSMEREAHKGAEVGGWRWCVERRLEALAGIACHGAWRPPLGPHLHPLQREAKRCIHTPSLSHTHTHTHAHTLTHTHTHTHAHAHAHTHVHTHTHTHILARRTRRSGSRPRLRRR